MPGLQIPRVVAGYQQGQTALHLASATGAIGLVFMKYQTHNFESRNDSHFRAVGYRSHRLIRDGNICFFFGTVDKSV